MTRIRAKVPTMSRGERGNALVVAIILLLLASVITLLRRLESHRARNTSVCCQRR